jgi:hypothetical protein
VLATANVVVPASFATFRRPGVTDNIGCAGVSAWVTVTSIGLPVAPAAVTWIVPVRGVIAELAVNAQLMVPASVPLPPDVIDNQLPPDVTTAVHGIVPVPVLATLNVVVPASFATFRVAGVTDKMGCAGVSAWVTVTSIGLPVAPVAVTRIVAVRGDVLVLAVNVQVMIPASVPLVGLMESQATSGFSAADQGIVPVPVLAILNVVVPASFATFRVAGVTDKMGCAGVSAWVTVTSSGLPVAPIAVIRIVAVRGDVLVLAVNVQVMVPASVPLVGLMESQATSGFSAAVHDIVPAPVLKTLNVVVPASFATAWLTGFTLSAGLPACVTVTSSGLPVAPVAVIRIVAVRGDVLVLAVNVQVMVPASVPLVGLMESQATSGFSAAVHGIVPVPVLATLNVVVPASFATFRVAGVTDKMGCAGVSAWVTVTSSGLPIAPVAVTRIVAVRGDVLVLAVNVQVMVPASVPLVGLMESQATSGFSAAVHDIVPAPVLKTLNVVVPASFATAWLTGFTLSAGLPACVTVTSTGLPTAPAAVTRIVAVRGEVLVFAVYVQVMVPVSVPLPPDVIDNQLPPDVTTAVHGIVPVPVLATLKLVVPASFATFCVGGVTDKIGCAGVSA